MPIAIGVDVGGSHISSAAVDIERSEIIKGTYFHGNLDSKASKEEIFERWSSVINRTLGASEGQGVSGVGMAMPGPFRYKEGIACFEGNDKYEQLYGVSVLNELPGYLDKDVSLRFLNDATSFGVGGALMNKDKNGNRVTAITLGTGFGAAFLERGIPETAGSRVPENGCLWDKPFLEGMADDYFSTRWFLSRYTELSGENGLKGVRDLLEVTDIDVSRIFEEFAQNLCSFMLPHLRRFETDLLVMGGSISRAYEYFLPRLRECWNKDGLDIPVAVVPNTEEASIIGAAHLYDHAFWNEVKDRLPEK
ncbi:ROK family protein [Sinomicrobium soli]|uniref:ROK family protein n=1 Tax=Sinomicrobium sp. N-1-3-6 TaxID=2219864 RepID=UPI000DCE6353|nr:ROK family protein [Sinomicrobium sp. N-1-3-6]RAV30896.1 ROK family protein [Sinomicrobium sp. N-1-3-6]